MSSKDHEALLPSMPSMQIMAPAPIPSAASQKLLEGTTFSNQSYPVSSDHEARVAPHSTLSYKDLYIPPWVMLVLAIGGITLFPPTAIAAIVFVILLWNKMPSPYPDNKNAAPLLSSDAAPPYSTLPHSSEAPGSTTGPATTEPQVQIPDQERTLYRLRVTLWLLAATYLLGIILALTYLIIFVRVLPAALKGFFYYGTTAGLDTSLTPH